MGNIEIGLQLFTSSFGPVLLMGMIFAVFQTFGKILSDKLLLIKNVILMDIIS